MEDLKNIADLITSIDPGRNPLGTFADYVEILALSFANIPPKNGLNGRYKAVMGKYTAKQQKIFPEVTGRIIMYLTQKGVIHDVFGIFTCRFPLETATLDSSSRLVTYPD